MAPATMTPEQAPIDWMMTFWPRVLALGGSCQSYGDDGDGYGGLKHLAYLQAEIGRGGTENDGHEEAQHERPRRHLAGIGLRGHQRLVFFAFLQRTEGIFGKRVL